MFRPSTSASLSYGDWRRRRVGRHVPFSVEQRAGDVGAEPGPGRDEALDPECSLVQAVQLVLPGEADSSVDLDRRLADRNRRLGGRGLRRSGCNGRLLVALGDAPGRPERERAGELELCVRIREPVRDRLVGANRSPELLSRRDVLDRELEGARRDPAGLERECRERARTDLREDSRRCEQSAGLASAHDAERTRAVRGREHLALGSLELVDPVSADDRDAVGGVEVRDERGERERPARLPGGYLGSEIGRKRRQRERDCREVRSVVEGAAELLEEDGLLDEREAGTSRVLGDRDPGPAEFRQLLPRRLGTPGQERARLLAELV